MLQPVEVQEVHIFYRDSLLTSTIHIRNTIIC